MRTIFRKPIAALLFVAALASPAAADKQFNPGALILPTSSAYQTDCGAVAVYGLVYDVLRANAYLAANPALAPGGPIEIYYSFKDVKASPNRCTPTNKNTNPAPAADPKWIDGCDFNVYDNTKTPVKLVVNTSTDFSGATTDLLVSTRDTTPDAVGVNPKIFPGFAAQSVDFALGVNTVRYAGAPFIIDSVDAPTFLKLLQGTLVANDKADGTGNTIDFSPFRVNNGSCNYSSDTGGWVNIHRAKTIFTAPAPKQFIAAPPRVALLATTAGLSTYDTQYNAAVNISNSGSPGAAEVGNVVTIKSGSNHNLAVGDYVRIQGVGVAAYNGYFVVTSIPGSRRFTVNNVTTGLVNAGGGNFQRPGAYEIGTTVTMYTTNPHVYSIGSTVAVSGMTQAGYNGVFTVTAIPTTKSFRYTTVAGLTPEFSGVGQSQINVAGATKKVSDGILQKYLKIAGLSFSGAGGCPPGGINVGNLAKCPLGGVRGQIYDTFDFSDITSGLLDANYKMIWTPHWETTSDAISLPNAGEQTAINKIATFLDGQTGLMAECHSIEAFEGSYLNGGLGGASDPSSGGTAGTGSKGIAAGQFQTCVGSAGACTGGATDFGVDKDVANPAKDLFWPNCSDPNRSGSDTCIYFSAPGDPFAQPGDFSWNDKGGSVQNFKPNSSTGAIYKPGVTPLISGVRSLNMGFLSSPAAARAMIDADYATRSNKDNDTTKGNIIYVSGHDVSGQVSGTKVILQTLLLLGEPAINTITTEVSRATPITSTITTSSGAVNAVVQGSFELIQPPNTTLTADTDAQVAAFRFPDVIGHMRAFDTANITTSQIDFASIAPVFDAATAMPNTSNSYTGCGTASYGAGTTGNCRTIFTHTASSYAPPPVILDNTAVANVPLLAAINATVSGTTGTISAGGAFPTFIQRLLAGTESSPGVFVPKLGGVDRSTVAIISSSLVAGGARPKVVYFGGSDGMLHAVCASEVANTGCPVGALGRELWGFIPRLQLPLLRKNRAFIQGSPRTMDMYGDFTSGSGTGAKSFHTILMFTTGTGDPATAAQMPSVTALDVTNPYAPRIVFEYSLANAASRAAFEPGQGLVLAAGPVRVGGVYKSYAFVQTNNGGTAGVGNVVAAIDMETGQSVWQNTMTFPVSGVGRAMGAPPDTGIPSGAVGVDKLGTGGISDVVFTNLYGEIWQVDATNGVSRHGTNPLFRYSTDQHPFGASPTIYQNSGQLYAMAASGGYADLSTSPSLWSATDQSVVSVSLSTPLGSAPLNETTGGVYQPWTYPLGSGDRSFSQAIVVGGTVFITTDSADVNSSTYGAAGADTGKVYALNVGTGALDTTVVVRGGAGSVNTNTAGTEVYNLSKDKAEKFVATATVGEAPPAASTTKITRLLWLRTL